MGKQGIATYNRSVAVAYAHQWAEGRNPRYYNFSGIGGDCANFASQCVYAGAGVMNHTPTYGWYYNSVNDRAPAWSSVRYLHRFLTQNTGPGPHGRETDLEQVLPGDVLQIATYLEDFHHTLVVVHAPPSPTLETVLVAAHSYDCDNRPLATYEIQKLRCIHILGVRK